MSTPVMPIVVTDKEGERLIGNWLYYNSKVKGADSCLTNRGKEKQRAKWLPKREETMAELAPWLERNYAEFSDRIVNVGEFGSHRRMYRCIYVRRIDAHSDSGNH